MNANSIMKKIDTMHMPMPPTTPISPTYSIRNLVKGALKKSMFLSKTIAEESSNFQAMINEQIDTPDMFSSLVKIQTADGGMPITSQVESVLSYPNTNMTNSPKNLLNLGKTYKSSVS